MTGQRRRTDRALHRLRDQSQRRGTTSQRRRGRHLHPAPAGVAGSVRGNDASDYTLRIDCIDETLAAPNLGMSVARGAGSSATARATTGSPPAPTS